MPAWRDIARTTLSATVPQIVDEGILPRPRDLLMGGEVTARREIAPRITPLAPAELQIVRNRIDSGRRDVRVSREVPSLIEAAGTAGELFVILAVDAWRGDTVRLPCRK
jgi:hypothetical protein